MAESRASFPAFLAVLLLFYAPQSSCQDCPFAPSAQVGSLNIYLSSAPRTWNYARRACPSGSELIKYNTQAEFDAILDLALATAEGRIWTGLHNPDSVDCCCHEDECDGLLKWQADGSVFQESAVAPIVDGKPQVGCLYFDGGFYSGGSFPGLQRFEECDGPEIRFACGCVGTPVTACPAGENDLLGTTSYYLSSWKRTFKASKDRCEVGSELAVFDTQAAADLVKGYAGSVNEGYVWTALHNPDQVSCLTSTCDGKLKWYPDDADFAESALVSFAQGSVTDECVAFSSDGGVYPAPCTGTEYKYVCSCVNPPVDGVWSAWSNGPCSLACGGGTLTQDRVCDSPAPSFGGSACPGDRTNTLDCNTHVCPVDGGWSPWADGPCSVTCDGGTMTRTRACDNPPQAGTGADCVGADSETGVACSTQACPPCPPWDSGLEAEEQHFWFDGSFIAMSPAAMTYAAAKTFCEDLDLGWTLAELWHHAYVKYYVENVGAAGDNYWINAENPDGFSCADTAACDGVLKDRDGGVLSTADFDSITDRVQIAQPSAAAELCVQFDHAELGLRSADCSLANRAICINYCRVDGQWTSWYDNGNVCSVTCGGGTKDQKRWCSEPIPAMGGQDCPGSDVQTGVACNTEVCPPCPPTADGWDQFGSGKFYHISPSAMGWADAETYCEDQGVGYYLASVIDDAGEVTYFVSVNSDSWVDLANPDGVSCDGNDACDELLKDASGNTFDSVGYANKGDVAGIAGANTCVFVDTAKRISSAADCGDLKTVICQAHCDIDGGWTDWMEDQPCSATCGGGTMDLRRVCRDPYPGRAGADCPESDTQSGVACNIHTCPAEWSDWGEWGPCSATCYHGVRRRDRACVPAGGCSGLGPEAQFEYCDSSDADCAADGVVTAGSVMAAHRVGEAASTAFLADSTAVAVPTQLDASDTRRRIFCGAACLARGDRTSCNAFAVTADGSCEIGVVDLDWLWEQTGGGSGQAGGGDDVLYVDAHFP